MEYSPTLNVLSIGLNKEIDALRKVKKEIKELLAEFKKPPSVQRDYVEITKTDKIRLLDFIKQDRPEYYGITYFLLKADLKMVEINKRYIYKENAMLGLFKTKKKTATILVVDDEKNIRMTMSQSLEPLGIPIRTAVNGEEALQMIRGNREFREAGREARRRVSRPPPAALACPVSGRGRSRGSSCACTWPATRPTRCTPSPASGRFARNMSTACSTSRSSTCWHRSGQTTPSAAQTLPSARTPSYAS